MRRITMMSATICFLLLAGLVQAGPDRPFKATFHGYAEPPVQIGNSSVYEIVVPLHGTATHLGAFDELLVHYFDFSDLSFIGYAYWTAANGDTFTTEFTGQGYPTNDPSWITFDVVHTIVAGSGTGRFVDASGTFIGVEGRFNVDTLEDLGGYSGTIAY